MTNISKLITSTGISLYITGHAPFSMSSDHKYFSKLREAVASNNLEDILSVIDLANQAKRYMKGRINIEDGMVTYDGEPVHGLITQHIMDFMGNNENADHLIAFLERVMKNPSAQSREELYLFLESEKMPITEDGRFIAFKWVREDGFDCHSGTNYHEVGAIHEMERGKVNDDRRQTCSYGLHVCSSGYTKFGSRLFLVAVDPADVVSVPYDYNNSKMRVAKYEVLEELDESGYTSFRENVWQQKETVKQIQGYTYDPEYDEYYDEHGDYYTLDEILELQEDD